MVRVIGPLGGWQEWLPLTENQRDLLAIIEKIFEELNIEFKWDVKVIDRLGGFQEWGVVTENQKVIEEALQALKKHLSSFRPRFRQPFPYYDGHYPQQFPNDGFYPRPRPRSGPVNEDADAKAVSE